MSAEVTVRYWAGARRAAGHASAQHYAETVGELLASLRVSPDLAAVISACSVLVDGQASSAATELSDGNVVDLLPPFAGG